MRRSAHFRILFATQILRRCRIIVNQELHFNPVLITSSYLWRASVCELCTAGTSWVRHTPSLSGCPARVLIASGSPEVDEAGEEEGGGGGESADEGRLDGAAPRSDVRKFCLDVAEAEEREKRDADRDAERCEDVGGDHVRRKGNQPADDVGGGNRGGAAAGARRVGLLEAELEA